MSQKVAVWMAAVAFAASMVATAAHAQTKTAATASTISPQVLKAKTDYCKTCHGIYGQGFRATLPIPRLAGQQPDYIENQLKAFVEKRRESSVMHQVVGVLSPAMIEALTSEFKSLNPKPLGGAPAAHAAEGKKIFQEGIPDKSVPACASCHGPEAKGDGQFPRLAGQLYDYVIRKLTNWEKERGLDKANPDVSAIMQPIAHDLTPAQIAAVAAYVSELQ